MSDLAAGKKAAAVKAVNDYVKVCPTNTLTIKCIFSYSYLLQDNQKLGIGSGSTIVFAVERLGIVN